VPDTNGASERGANGYGILEIKSVYYDFNEKSMLLKQASRKPYIKQSELENHKSIFKGDKNKKQIILNTECEDVLDNQKVVRKPNDGPRGPATKTNAERVDLLFNNDPKKPHANPASNKVDKRGSKETDELYSQMSKKSDNKHVPKKEDNKREINSHKGKDKDEKPVTEKSEAASSLQALKDKEKVVPGRICKQTISQSVNKVILNKNDNIKLKGIKRNKEIDKSIVIEDKKVNEQLDNRLNLNNECNSSI
jgi:hypothetical protein